MIECLMLPFQILEGIACINTSNNKVQFIMYYIYALKSCSTKESIKFDIDSKEN